MCRNLGCDTSHFGTLWSSRTVSEHSVYRCGLKASHSQCSINDTSNSHDSKQMQACLYVAAAGIVTVNHQQKLEKKGEGHCVPLCAMVKICVIYEQHMRPSTGQCVPQGFIYRQKFPTEANNGKQ